MLNQILTLLVLQYNRIDREHVHIFIAKVRHQKKLTL